MVNGKLLLFIVLAFVSYCFGQSFNPTNYTEVRTTVNGYTESSDIARYFVNVGQGENVIVDIEYSDPNTASYIGIQLQGDENEVTYTGKVSTSLSLQCPKYAAKYYLSVYTDSKINFTISITRRNITQLPYGVSTGTEQFLNGIGYIAIPVTAQCGTLFVDVVIDGGDTDLFYECNSYFSPECIDAGASYQEILYGSSDDGSHSQLLVSCTSPGTYYLFLETNSDLEVSYSVNITETYPCGNSCIFGGGICDANLTCECPYNRVGPNCTSLYPPSGPSTLPVVNETLSPDETELDLVSNINNTYEVTIPVSNTDPAFVIDLTITFAQQMEPLTFNSTSGVGQYLKQIDYVFNLPREIFLCSLADWDIGIQAKSNVALSAKLADVQLTGNTFDGVITFSENSVTRTQVFQYVATGAATTVQMQENSPTITYLGIYSASTCRALLGGADNSGDDNDAGYDKGFYQVSIPTTVGESYYIVVQGNNGASYNGIVIDQAAGTCNCTSAKNGLCAPSGVCQCRRHYTGTSCEQLVIPTSAVQLTTQSDVELTFDGSSTYEQSAVYVVPSVVPAGYRVSMTISNMETTDALHGNVYLQYAIGSLPGPFLYAQNLIRVNYNSSEIWHDVCPHATDTQYYFVVYAASAAKIALSLSIVDATIEIGTPVTFPLLPSTVAPFNFLVAVLPANCSSAYKVELTNSDVSVFVSRDYDYVCVDQPSGISGGGSPTSSGVYVDDGGYGIIATPDCGVILVSSYSYVQASANATILITPTTPCPINCNDAGTCLEGGVCSCTYPYFGSDCSNYDTKCYTSSEVPIPSVCASLANSFDFEYFEDYSLDYCDLMDSSTFINTYPSQFQASLSKDGIQLSQDCQNELNQILCTYTFSPCIYNQNELQLGFPCNGFTYMSRCVPASYTGSFDVVEDIDLYVDFTGSLFVCQNYTNTTFPTPSPTPKPTPSATTSPTPSPTTSPTNTPSPSTSPTPVPTTPAPTNAPISAAYKLHVCYYVAIVIFGLVIAL